MSTTAISEPAARPPRRGCAPSGTAISAKAKQAAGNAKRRYISTRASRQPGVLSHARRHQPADLDGPIALSKAGDRVAVGIAALELVCATTLQMQLQLALFR